MGRVVLVAGVSRAPGAALARALCDDPAVSHVVGVDVVPPAEDLGGTEFIRADVRNPVIVRVLQRARVDTLVHLNVVGSPRHAGGRVSMKETNVLGTMQLLAACQKCDTLSRLVVRSTTAVYGAGPGDPAHFTEDTPARRLPRGGWGHDALEVEAYARGFARRRPDVQVLVLRLADVVGVDEDNPLTDYFALPAPPTVLGFDPRLQVLHGHDALRALHRATVGTATGVVNVAGPGTLTVTQALHLAGRVPVPVPAPLLPVVARALRTGHVGDLPDDLMALLRYGRGLDLTRQREVLGLTDVRTTREAFTGFVREAGLLGPLTPDLVHDAEHRAKALLRTALGGAP